MATLLIRKMPEELKDFILETQLKLKLKKKNETYSQEKTVLHIIREYKKTIDKIN